MRVPDIELSAFRSLMQEAPLGIAFADREQHLQLVNPALCSMLGYSSDELIGCAVSQIVDPVDYEAEQPLIEQLASGSRPAYQLEKRFVRKDGGRLWVRASVALWDIPDSPQGFFSVALDITELRQLREELAQNQERLSLSIEASRTGI